MENKKSRQQALEATEWSHGWVIISLLMPGPLSSQTSTTYWESGVWQDWVGKTHAVQRSPLEIHMFLELPQSLRALKPGCSSILLWISCGVSFRKSCSDRGVGGDETEEKPLQYQQHCWDSIIVWWHWPHSSTPLALTFIPFPCSGSWWKLGSLLFLSCHQSSPDSLALHSSVVLETAWQPKMQKP